MYVNEGYENYKYLVEASDNYIILSNVSYADGSWDAPDTVDVIYQYIKPSILTIESKIRYTTTKEFVKIEQTDNYWNRGDACEITIAGFIMLFFIMFIINGLTRLVRKGGVFFGS